MYVIVYTSNESFRKYTRTVSEYRRDSKDGREKDWTTYVVPVRV
jgi:hypothetical protein